MKLVGPPGVAYVLAENVGYHLREISDIKKLFT